MALQTATIPVAFGKGLDTKTDSKYVVAGKMLQLQDAVFTQAQQIDKRNGYIQLPTAIAGGGNLVAPTMVKALENELVCADSGLLYSYSPSSSAWINKGSYVSTAVTSSKLSTSQYAQSNATSATLGNYTLYAWLEDHYDPITDVSTYGTAYTIVDNSNGVTILPPVQASLAPPMTTLNLPRACVSAGTNLALFYDDGTATQVLVFTITGGSVTALGLHPSNYPLWDTANTPTGVAIVLNSSGHLTVETLDSTFTATGSVNLTSPGVIETATIETDPVTGNYWVFWAVVNGGSSLLYYAVLSPSLAILAGPFTASVNTPVTQVVAFKTSPTQYKALYTYSNAAVVASTFSTAGILCNFNGTTSLDGFQALGLGLQSKTFNIGGTEYVTMAYQSKVANPVTNVVVGSPQNSLFLVVANAIAPAEQNLGLQVAQFQYGSTVRTPTFSSAMSRPLVNGSTATFPSQFMYSVEAVPLRTYDLSGINIVKFDFASPDLNQAVIANRNMVLNGGKLWHYDGIAISELGFSIYPEVVSATRVGAGNVASGKYGYYAVLQWNDAKGDLHQSAPSVQLPYTSTGDEVTVVVKIPYLTSKIGPVSLALFRTSANTNTAYLLARQQLLGGAFVYTFDDNYSDANVIGNDALYTNGGVLENIVPPPSVAVKVHSNRLWLIDSESPNTLWYSKSLTPGIGISFSDLLTVEVNSVGGDCKALASMDDKLVIFEERQPLVMGGDGANDAGSGSTLTPPQPVPSDTGAVGSKGLETFPMGVLFKSAKGIYLLTRSLEVKYWGMEVEKYNSQTITSALIMPSRNQIRFLCSSGLTLVYDYIMAQWATFTNHIGCSSDVWKGNYVYVRMDGTIYQEVPGFYLDNTTPYAPLLQTAWLNMGEIQGYHRARLFELLGNFTNGTTSGHGITVQAAYDFDPTNTTTPVTYDLTALTTPSYQYREFLERQKCDSITLTIQEVVTGDSAEFITFTDLSFEAGVKKGPSKLQKSQSVGG